MNEWEVWMRNNGVPDEELKFTEYDKICELAVSTYDLNNRTRKAPHIDRIQFFILWWKKNQKYMIRYNTYEKIAALIKRDHSDISNHLNTRKPTYNYEENTACIRDFLES